MAFLIHRNLPKTYTDLGAFCFLLFAIHGIGFFELLVVIPSIYNPTISSPNPDDSNQQSYAYDGNSAHHMPVSVHWFFGFFIYGNVLMNLYKVIKTNTSVRGVMMPSVMKRGWRYCVVCECNAPPRSFHCHVCNICILKRDHHCIFTGNCVGIGNQRYYLGLLLYLMFAAGYSCSLNIDFLYHYMGGISFTTILVITFPMISWIFIRSEAVSSFQIFMISLAIIGFFMTAGLLCYHLNNVFNGQTVHEKSFNCCDYDIGWKENFKQSFGSRWLLALLCPLANSPLPTDGLEFITKQHFESLKTM